MKPLSKTKSMPDELKLAIGLIWGHLKARQHREASQLAQGCLAIWPAQLELEMMLAYASIELEEGLGDHLREVLTNADCDEWAALVFRRAAGAAPC